MGFALPPRGIRRLLLGHLQVSRPAVRLSLEPLDFSVLRAELVRFRATPGRRLPHPGTPRPAATKSSPQLRPRPSPTVARAADGTLAAPGAHPVAAAAVASGTAETGAPDVAVADLVTRSQRGDAEAFGLLYDRYVDLVYRYIYYRVASPPLAEDLVSETFLRALRRIDSFSWQGRDFAAWLVTIARNLIADHFKSGRYRLEITTEDILDGPATAGPESLVLDSFTNATLLNAVKQLNPQQQECIVLRFLQGMSVNETALAMGKNEGAIKALQYRAVRALARLLPEETVR